VAIERGRLPAGWRWSALADVARILGGSTPSSSVQEYWNGDILWVTPTDLSTLVGHTVVDSARKITIEGFASAGLELLPAGSVVMSSRAPIGYLAIAGRPLATNQGCKSFVPNESLIIPEFLYLALSYQMPTIVAAGAGATFAEVSKSKLESIEIALPGITEQRRIVAALDERRAALEDTQAKAREVTDLCEALRRKLTLEAFATNPVAAESRSWPWARLRTLIESTKNGLYTPENNYGAGTPILKMFNIGRFTGRFELRRLDRISLSDDELRPFRLEPGDIVVNRVNSAELVAKSALVTEREAGSIFESKNIRLRVRRAVADPSYICAALNNEFTRRQIFDGRKQIIGMATIDRETLDNIEIALPPLEEQISIMNRLRRDSSALDAARIGANAQTVELSALEPALLRAAFSGAL
jgi:type I restriction enzyme S subunit